MIIPFQLRRRFLMFIPINRIAILDFDSLPQNFIRAQSTFIQLLLLSQELRQQDGWHVDVTGSALFRVTSIYFANDKTSTASNSAVCPSTPPNPCQTHKVLGAPPRSILVWGRGRRRRRHGPSHLKTKAPPWGWSLSAFGFHPGLKGDVQVKGT
ncbi:hypothetical protein BDP67DRAFT_567382 [Colletotrichum lupini]|nr:hypothetical protein BDP67DRAFT_567382 [Colletotrichum lupini]